MARSSDLVRLNGIKKEKFSKIRITINNRWFFFDLQRRVTFMKKKKMILNTYILHTYASCYPLLEITHLHQRHFHNFIYALELNENIVTVPSSDGQKIKWKYEYEKVIPSPLPTKIANFVFVFEISQSCKIFKIPVEFLHM